MKVGDAPLIFPDGWSQDLMQFMQILDLCEGVSAPGPALQGRTGVWTLLAEPHVVLIKQRQGCIYPEGNPAQGV